MGVCDDNPILEPKAFERGNKTVDLSFLVVIRQFPADLNGLYFSAFGESNKVTFALLVVEKIGQIASPAFEMGEGDVFQLMAQIRIGAFLDDMRETRVAGVDFLGGEETGLGRVCELLDALDEATFRQMIEVVEDRFGSLNVYGILQAAE